jgi:hypothetical protein
VREISARDPVVTRADRDEDITGLHFSLEDFYKSQGAESEPGAAGLDGDLRAIFDDLGAAESTAKPADTKPAAALIRRLERQLMVDVFRWTGHFPEKTRSLVRDLARRAETLAQVYPSGAEQQAVVGVTILVTSLAMNYVHRGAYFPEPVPPSAPSAGDSRPSETDQKAQGGIEKG